jgi:hypothetical protein
VGVGLGALALAFSAVSTLVPAPQAGALTQKQITIDKVGTVTASFSPILVPYPLNNIIGWTPSGCGNGDPETPGGRQDHPPKAPSDIDNPPPAGATCDRIPLKVIPPKGLAAADDYIVTIAVSWTDPIGLTCAKTQQTPQVSIKVTCGNDLDMYVYDNTDIAWRKNPDEDTQQYPGYTDLSDSTTTKNPEVVTLGNPDLPLYNIVVQNVSGINTGYTITVNMRISHADPVFELLEGSLAPTQPAVEVPPVDLSALPLPTSDVIPGLEQLSVTPDLELDTATVGAPSLAAQIQAPPLARDIETPKPPGPASGALLVLWLVIVPIALLGGSLGILWRRGTLGTSRLG